MTTNPADRQLDAPAPQAQAVRSPATAEEKNYPNALAAALLSSLLAAAIAWIIAFIAFGFLSDEVSTSKWPMACALLAASGAYVVKWLMLKSAKRI